MTEKLSIRQTQTCIIGRVVTDSLRKCRAFIFMGQVAWPSRWNYYNPWQHQKPLPQQHSGTSQKTWILSDNAV